MFATLATVATAWLAPPAARGQTSAPEPAPESGYRLLGTAQAGVLYANDPTFLVPYADQAAVSANGELTKVSALGQASPAFPGSAASLATTLVQFLCPECPSPPQPVRYTATAQPPETERDEVTPGGVRLGALTIDGMRGSAEAIVDDRVEASASTGRITGVDTGVPLTSGEARVSLRSPGADGGPAASADAAVGLGGVTVVSVATALPTPSATVGLRQPDGSITPIPAEGVDLGPDTRLEPSTETGDGTARAGAVVEHHTPTGVINRTTVLSVSVSVLGTVTGATRPGALGEFTTAGAGVGGDAASDLVVAPAPAVQGARSAPTPAAQARAGTPVVRPNVRPVVSIVGDRAWLLWVFLAWLSMGAAAATAGRRWLAPRVAADAVRTRAARAAAFDHLDQRGER